MEILNTQLKPTNNMIKKLLLLPIILLVNILANAQIFTFENPMDTNVSTVFSCSYYYNSKVKIIKINLIEF